MDAVWQIEKDIDRLGDGAGASASSTALPSDDIQRYVICNAGDMEMMNTDAAFILSHPEIPQCQLRQRG